jgi:Zn-finger nucleic acid-binding protein
MNAPSSLLCPACNRALRSAHATYGVAACDGCGGVWTDRATSEALRTSSDGEITSVAKDVAEHAEATVPADRRRRCPECQRRLRKSTVAGVQIDSCAAHGTWFDRGEVERIYTETKKPGAATSLGSVALGVIEVFGAILSAL